MDAAPGALERQAHALHAISPEPVSGSPGCASGGRHFGGTDHCDISVPRGLDQPIRRAGTAFTRASEPTTKSEPGNGLTS